jgi:hypothetical protein
MGGGSLTENDAGKSFSATENPAEKGFSAAENPAGNGEGAQQIRARISEKVCGSGIENRFCRVNEE